MKILLCFVILFSIGRCTDYRAVTLNNYEREYVNAGAYEYDEKYEDYRVGNNYSEPIIYPCAVHDTHCIRRFFAQNSRCNPVEGPTPDPYILKRKTHNIPHANASLIQRNAPLQGLHNWKIQEFFINKATDRLVLEVVFDKIMITSQRTTLRFYLKGKEPIDLTDFATIEYNDVSLTLIIPYLKDIQLSRSHVYTYLPEAFPKFVLGPGLLKSTDPVVTASLLAITGNTPLTIREVYVTQGPVFMSIFFQSTICDFEY